MLIVADFIRAIEITVIAMTIVHLQVQDPGATEQREEVATTSSQDTTTTRRDRIGSGTMLQENRATSTSHEKDTGRRLYQPTR